MCAFLRGFLSFSLLSTVLVVAGCGKSDTIVSSENTVPSGALSSASDLKKILTLIAESGEAGSALDGMSDTITKLDVADDKKQKLQGLYTQLEKARQPAAIKKIAGEMAAELP